jgi:uncharacterized membrane protein
LVHRTWEVPVMAELGEHKADRPTGRGGLRASHADREQVIDTLKDAFVQGRLTKDEFDSRVSDVLASRTYADLAALTADLPAGPPPAKRMRQPIPARPRRPANNTVKNGARVIAVTSVLTAGVWAGAVFSNTDNQVMGSLAMTFTFLWLGIVLLVGAIMAESRLQQRSGRQLPPAHGQSGHGGHGGHGGRAPKRVIPTDPAGQLRPGDHQGRNAAEASRSPLIRPSLLPGPHLSPS